MASKEVFEASVLRYLCDRSSNAIPPTEGEAQKLMAKFVARLPRGVGHSVESVWRIRDITGDQIVSVTLENDELGRPWNDDDIFRIAKRLGIPEETTLRAIRAKNVLPEIHVERFTPEDLHELELDPTKLRLLTPEQFEDFTANRLDKMGFHVQSVGGTNTRDGGIDLIAYPKVASVCGILIAVQVKHHKGNQKTGSAAVERLVAWKDHHFNIGVLVTNTQFTRNAKFVAEREKVFLRLRDFEDVSQWIRGNLSRMHEWREFPKSIVLAPGIEVQLQPNPKVVVKAVKFK
jgi:Restriction endonuclease